MVAHGGYTGPSAPPADPNPAARALTSKAAMPAATPPTTSAFVLMSSKIWSKQPCGSSQAGEDGHGAVTPPARGHFPQEKYRGSGPELHGHEDGRGGQLSHPSGQSPTSPRGGEMREFGTRQWKVLCSSPAGHWGRVKATAAPQGLSTQGIAVPRAQAGDKGWVPLPMPGCTPKLGAARRQEPHACSYLDMTSCRE